MLEACGKDLALALVSIQVARGDVILVTGTGTNPKVELVFPQAWQTILRVNSDT